MHDHVDASPGGHGERAVQDGSGAAGVGHAQVVAPGGEGHGSDHRLGRDGRGDPPIVDVEVDRAPGQALQQVDVTG